MKYLTYTNAGCTDLCKNMIASLMLCGVSGDDIYIHCFDGESLREMQNTGCHAFIRFSLSSSSNLNAYQEWSFDPGSNFAQIVSWKWKIIREFSKQHSEFIFTDTDIVFKKNVEEDLRSYNKNICIQGDSPGSHYCTGFMYFKQSPEAVRIINACANNHMDDQIIFNRMVHEVGIQDSIQLLPTDKYPNGHVYYKTPIDKSKVYIIHNNHMIGKQTKIDAFKAEGNWLL